MTATNWTDNIYAANGWAKAHGGTTEVREAATGNVLTRIGVADDSDVNTAARTAAKAGAAWAETPFDQRAAVMRKAAALLQERAATFNDWNVRECGSIVPKAEWELHATVEQISMAAALPMEAHGLLFPSSMPGRTNMWRRVPIGVVGVIAPWNFPLLLGMRSVAPALALGNAVVLKPDTQSAVTGGLLVAQLFEDAGLPAGVLQVLPGGAATGDALVRHPAVGMISFTGSTAVGRQIGEICGRMLKKTALELGGNNAMVVLADADLDGAASCAAWSAFLHQGQICMQAGRHLVHRSVAEAYAGKLRERAAALHVGDPAKGPVHIGPLINDRQVAKVHDIVQSSIKAGARALIGAAHEGRMYQPTVLVDVTPDMPAFKEEIFGPVAPITIFDTDEEAIELVHRSDYGLAAAIHSLDLGRATAMAERLRCGMVHINDQTVNNEFQVPFGGMGASGNGGRFGGPANLDEFTQTQWISSKARPIRYPF
ncbi:benzaldehyde dehydrogenase [Variovorax sp. Root411]|uniref:benzaldehyde dehydrogenase n=1 Tax=Variovorax sp. Root411 TaxID=1736530 RepID=UPI0006FEFD7F|nr:benzaldehyde dehydrogenase [Variovorax sp. Root411]KQW64933.1 benzaldehyde dehydrogenase [Variovorax sp. Root411]